MANRLEQLIDYAHFLTNQRDPGEALFAFIARLVEESATDQGLVDAFAGVGFDLTQAAPDAEQRFMSTLAHLLDRGQQAGAVRTDIDAHDLKTLLVGCQAMHHPGKVSSGRGESHPPALTEPSVTVSRHSALAIQLGRNPMVQ